MVELKALFLHIFSKNNKLKVTIINRLEKNTFNGKILPCETTCKFYEVVINGNWSVDTVSFNKHQITTNKKLNNFIINLANKYLKPNMKDCFYCNDLNKSIEIDKDEWKEISSMM